MRILIYDINYAPELTGVGKYTGEMGAFLARQGHQVRVITAMPYYPEWRTHPDYRGRGWFTEVIEGVTVHRCPFFVPRRVTSVTRILHELSFVLSSLVYWCKVLAGGPVDVVIAVAPPFHIGFLPVLFARWRSIPLWLHLQDLQINMAKDLKMINNDRLLTMLFGIERFILQRATVVSTISPGMVQKIADKQVLTHSCVQFPNWVDNQFIQPLPQTASLRTEWEIRSTDRVILYSGSLGEKQGLELIIEAARHFSTRPDVLFLIVGSGGAKDRLQGLAWHYGLTNVRFYPLQPYDRLPALLATADLHLILQKKSASDLVLPSKLTSILAAGGCTLVAAVPNTTLYDLITEHQMGLIIEPESAQALIQGIETALCQDLTPYRQRACQYARVYLNKQTILEMFESQLQQLAESMVNQFA